MSMGYAAGYADVVEEKTVKKNAPKAFRAFVKALKNGVSPETGEKGVSLEEFAKEAMYESAEYMTETYGDVFEAYQELCDAFEQATNLKIDVAFHDQDSDGSEYDEVDGAFWCVGGVWQLTPAGAQMGPLVKRKMYVTMG